MCFVQSGTQATVYVYPSSLPVTHPCALCPSFLRPRARAETPQHHRRSFTPTTHVIHCVATSSTSRTSKSLRSAFGLGSESICCRASPQLPSLPAFANKYLSRHPSAHSRPRACAIRTHGSQTVRGGVRCWCLRGHLRRMVFVWECTVSVLVISRTRLQSYPNPNPNGRAFFTCVCMLGS